MIPIIKKEWQQYFSGMLGYLIIIVFLLISGLVVFILPETGILDGGYATLEPFFSIAPYIMLFLIIFFHCPVYHVVSYPSSNHEEFQR